MSFLSQSLSFAIKSQSFYTYLCFTFGLRRSTMTKIVFCLYDMICGLKLKVLFCKSKPVGPKIVASFSISNILRNKWRTMKCRPKCLILIEHRLKLQQIILGALKWSACDPTFCLTRCWTKC